MSDPPPPAAAPVAPDLINLPGTLRRWFVALEPEQRLAVRQICRARRDNPCAGMMPSPKGAEDPLIAMYRAIPYGEGELDRFCTHRGAGICDTPLVVAFDAQPIAFVAATHARFAFTPGEPAATDWPTADTPWIALDRDGDGAITSGAELFGNATVLPDGSRARNGFEALAALDDNRDGVIDRRDRAFASLLLWADADGDRASAPGELRALASIVVAIPLANHAATRCDDRKNCEGERGIVQWRGAAGERTGAVVDVYLPRR